MACVDHLKVYYVVLRIIRYCCLLIAVSYLYNIYIFIHIYILFTY